MNKSIKSRAAVLFDMGLPRPFSKSKPIKVIDIDVDPLEGTNFAAKNLPGALSVISIAKKGDLFNAPETYMDKLAVSSRVPFEATDLDFPLEKNISNLADAMNKDIKNFRIYADGRYSSLKVAYKI